jgi:acyl dehydratase
MSMGLNYGCNKVRFPSPLPVGAKLRLGAALQNVEEVAGGVQAIIGVTIEVQGQDKPACVADVVYRYYD